MLDSGVWIKVELFYRGPLGYTTPSSCGCNCRSEFVGITAASIRQGDTENILHCDETGKLTLRNSMNPSA